MIFTDDQLPPDFDPRDVVGVLLERYYVGDPLPDVLLLERIPTLYRLAVWGLPGGKVEESEQHRDAASRELFEETGIRVHPAVFSRAGKFNVRHKTEFRNADFRYFVFRHVLRGQGALPLVRLEPREHQASLWASPRKALRLPLVEDQDSVFREVYRGKMAA